MPLYEYQCTKCKRRTEKIESVSGPHLKKCPHCGGKVESLISAPAIQFKGSGWYVTDYAGKSGGGDSATGAKSEASESKETTTKETKESKDSKETKEKKGSKKKD
ncbi:MAG TPA: FmdB family zinc ribbon protein [Terriglobales bacterium]|nr:FmdB family zinc ribbon protein [Terriglobales bacterium]